MTAFMKRNLKVFFRDKSSVFFSLLAVLIVLGLYVLFLGDQLVKSFEDKLEDPKRLMDSWIMAGILAVIFLGMALVAACPLSRCNCRCRPVMMPFYAIFMEIIASPLGGLACTKECWLVQIFHIRIS